MEAIRTWISEVFLPYSTEKPKWKDVIDVAYSAAYIEVFAKENPYISSCGIHSIKIKMIFILITCDLKSYYFIYY